MILCLAVRLARNAQSVVSEFCEIDATDQFWIDPAEAPEMEGFSASEDRSSFIDGIEAHRVVWFRSRRITILAGHV